MRIATQKPATVQELQARQRHYDRLHHLSRLAWLDAPAPRYSDGHRVLSHDAERLRRGSMHALRVIEDFGMSTNSVDLREASYLKELDSFGQVRKEVKA